MAQSFFIWNGVDCRSKGINLRGPVPIVRPEERVTHVEIPGRSGDLTETQGEQVYNSYIQTATMIVKNGHRVREAFKWLRGSGYVTFSGEPDRKQKARVIGAITLDKHSRNLDKWAGEVQFYCQPLKELMREETLTIPHNYTVPNLGDVPSKPKITATIGTVESRLLLFVTDGDIFSVDLTGASSVTSIIIDSETEMVTDGTGETDLTALSSGKFPTLAVGNSFLAFTTGLTLSMERRMRFL